MAGGGGGHTATVVASDHKAGPDGDHDSQKLRSSARATDQRSNGTVRAGTCACKPIAATQYELGAGATDRPIAHAEHDSCLARRPLTNEPGADHERLIADDQKSALQISDQPGAEMSNVPSETASGREICTATTRILQCRCSTHVRPGAAQPVRDTATAKGGNTPHTGACRKLHRACAASSRALRNTAINADTNQTPALKQPYWSG